MLFLRELQIGFGGGDVGGFLFDQRLLQRDLRIEVFDRGFRPRDIGMGLVQRGGKIAVVDPRQDLPGLDLLIVADQNFREISGDLGETRVELAFT